MYIVWTAYVRVFKFLSSRSGDVTN
ncbi:hypothetical protein THF1A12_50196 [Vibrio jasicida]|uniref:DUF3265 domain-containing protein n=1 Tax=Vibrio jasicida TaxID=766224 RepID=A0AAU9QX83_9VIBR|nr:hypothetical protein THF1A12_50196 [Vibrio jasicida]